MMGQDDSVWVRRNVTSDGWKAASLDVLVTMTLIFGASFVLLGFSYGRPWHGTSMPALLYCPQSLSRGISCIHYRHDIAMGSYLAGVFYFIVAGIIRLVAIGESRVDDVLWLITWPSRALLNFLSDRARRFVVDVALAATLIVLPSFVRAVLGTDLTHMSSQARIAFGLAVVASLCSSAVVIWAYGRPFGPYLRSALQEFFVGGFVVVVYLGRVWAGWTLEGVALATALIAGGATLSNWIGRYNSLRQATPS